MLKLDSIFKRSPELSLSEQRQRMENFGRKFKIPSDIRCELVQIDRVPAEWIRPAEIQRPAIMFYLHGGAYCAGSFESHRHLTAFLANQLGMQVLMIEYRLAPENPYPAALEDCVAAYKWLRRQYSDRPLVVAGDSAGGGLVVATLVKLRDTKLRLPAAAILLAPWVDLTCTNETYRMIGRKDLLLKQDRLLENAKMYAGVEPHTNPLISLVFADLSGLPPVLIQVGTHDVLIGDARMMAESINSTGGQVELEIWPRMIHVWHYLGERLREARAAVCLIGQFIRKYVD